MRAAKPLAYPSSHLIDKVPNVRIENAQKFNLGKDTARVQEKR